jgi:hypothetical protein
MAAGREMMQLKLRNGPYLRISFEANEEGED